jgi:hypothetical protein
MNGAAADAGCAEESVVREGATGAVGRRRGRVVELGWRSAGRGARRRHLHGWTGVGVQGREGAGAAETAEAADEGRHTCRWWFRRTVL